jgi:hypothetical protein
MERVNVVKLLIEHSGDVLDEMMSMYDGRGMTGFMLACQWNKVEVVELLICSSIGKSDVYDGFNLACQNKRTKIIVIILQNDQFRKHILKKEEDKIIRNPNGKIELRQQILNENKQLVISFNEGKHPLDIEIKVNSTLNEEEAEEIDGLGELPLKRAAKKGVISTARETLNFKHMFPQSSSKS